MGTDQIKKTLALVFDLGMAVEDHLSDDGKIKLNEVLSTLAAEALDIVDTIKNAGDLVAELKEWDPVERAEVLDWAVDYLELDNDKAEKLIELGLMLIKVAGDLIDLLKKEE